jgi:hypothetical protein
MKKRSGLPKDSSSEDSEESAESKKIDNLIDSIDAFCEVIAKQNDILIVQNKDLMRQLDALNEQNKILAEMLGFNQKDIAEYDKEREEWEKKLHPEKSEQHGKSFPEGRSERKRGDKK